MSKYIEFLDQTIEELKKQESELDSNQSKGRGEFYNN